MAEQRGGGPYIWVTWLSKILAGEATCEWASWFKAQHESWSWRKAQSSFDFVKWNMNHTEMLGGLRNRFVGEGYEVRVENQNAFTASGKTAKLGGKPDLVAIGPAQLIVDAKTGQPRTSDHVQVMTYMWALPRVDSRYSGVVFDGLVCYQDHEVPIPSNAIDAEFERRLADTVSRLASTAPAHKVPSFGECSWCDIGKEACPERIEEETWSQGGVDLF